MRQASAAHSEAAIAGFFADELAGRGWTRTATAAPAKDALAAFDTDGMHWAKGNLRFDLSFALQIMTPAAATPLSFTVRITRLRAK